MNGRCPLTIHGPDGQLVGLVRDLDATTILIVNYGVGSTLWLGVDNPKMIYTASDRDADEGGWGYGWDECTQDNAEHSWASSLKQGWQDIQEVFDVEAALMEEEWRQRFEEFVAKGDELYAQTDEERDDLAIFHEIASRIAPRRREQGVSAEAVADLEREAGGSPGDDYPADDDYVPASLEALGWREDGQPREGRE